VTDTHSCRPTSFLLDSWAEGSGSSEHGGVDIIRTLPHLLGSWFLVLGLAVTAAGGLDQSDPLLVETGIARKASCLLTVQAWR
jgi:hypothetical protein